MPRRPVDLDLELEKCGNEAVAAAVRLAIQKLFDHDIYLLKRNVHERTVSAALAFHMRGLFEGLNVDPEFNKIGDDAKSIQEGEVRRGIIPDIIVHRRGEPFGDNLLAIEIKCSKRGRTDRDIRKLEGMRRDLGYSYALFVRFDVGQQAGNVTELRWI